MTIKEIDEELKEAKRAASYALTLEEKIPLMRRIRYLKKLRYEAWTAEIINQFEEVK